MQKIEYDYLQTNRNYVDDMHQYDQIEYVHTETSDDNSDPFHSSEDHLSSYYFTKLG